MTFLYKTSSNKTKKRHIRCVFYKKIRIEHLLISQDVFTLETFTVKVLEILMLLERESYLKGAQGCGDIGNGIYPRSFKALNKNNLLVNIPRTRSGHFKPMRIELLKMQQAQINKLAVLLYRKGLSSLDVSHIMQDFFGLEMRYETVNNLSESFHKIRTKWEERALDAYYKVLYCDALYVSLKRNNSYSKEAVHVIYVVKEDNTRELLLLEINSAESHNLWGGNTLKNCKKEV